MKKVSYRTVRCILRKDNHYFMVIHSNRFRRHHNNWGFPGGRIERGEDLISALKRELREELTIQPENFLKVGDYRYKGHNHRIYGAIYDEPILRFDRREILKIGWHKLDDIRQFYESGDLHTGFEFEALQDFERLHGSPG